jgi:hypothetical protein
MPFVFREQNSLQRWRSNPISFIEEILGDPKTGAPFELFPAQQTFFSHCWKRTATRAAAINMSFRRAERFSLCMRQNYPASCDQISVHPDTLPQTALCRCIVLEVRLSLYNRKALSMAAVLSALDILAWRNRQFG